MDNSLIPDELDLTEYGNESESLHTACAADEVEVLEYSGDALTPQAPLAVQSKQLHATVDQMTKFVRGWHHGKGLPVDAEVASRMHGVIRMAEALNLVADIHPGVEGDCALVAYLKSPVTLQPHEFKIVILPNATYEVVISRWDHLGFSQDTGNPVMKRKRLLAAENLEDFEALPLVMEWTGYIRAGITSKPLTVYGS